MGISDSKTAEYAQIRACYAYIRGEVDEIALHKLFEHLRDKDRQERERETSQILPVL